MLNVIFFYRTQTEMYPSNLTLFHYLCLHYPLQTPSTLLRSVCWSFKCCTKLESSVTLFAHWLLQIKSGCPPGHKTLLGAFRLPYQQNRAMLTWPLHRSPTSMCSFCYTSGCKDRQEHLPKVTTILKKTQESRTNSSYPTDLNPMLLAHAISFISASLCCWSCAWLNSDAKLLACL